MRRIVEETPCPDCDRFHTESLLRPGGDPESSIAYCYTGGSRRVLTQGQYVLIEKVDGEWPDWAIKAGRVAVFAGWLRGIEALDPHPRNEDDLASIFLDALSDHTEGTP